MRPILSLRLLVAAAFAVPAGLTLTPLVEAAWSGGGAGAATAVAYTMPSGAQPTVSVVGTTVTVRWPTAMFPDNESVAGYVIRRYNAVNGGAGTVGTHCVGTITATTCTEANVPPGSWAYTDTPVEDNWTGGESAQSTAVAVA